MKITYLLTSLALMLLFGPQAYAIPQTDFELIKQDDNISLYERWIAGKGGEQVRELKTILTVHSNVKTILELLTDSRRGTTWNTNAVSYQVSPGQNHYGWTVYIRYGMPWPFNDQDCCLFYQMKLQTNHKTVLTFRSTVDPRFPLSNKTDRLTGVNGEWILEKWGEETTKVTYTITTDRSKKIPRWVSDPVIHNNLFSTMASFKTLAERNR